MKKQFINEAFRLQILAGIKPINSLAENINTNDPAVKDLEKKAFDFFNDPKVIDLLKKQVDKLSPEKKAELAKISMQENTGDDFSSFKSVVEPLIMEEIGDDMHDDVRSLGGYEPGEEPSAVDKVIGKIFQKLGVANLMSMGTLPMLTAMALDHFGGTDIINQLSQAAGSGTAAAALSVIGAYVAGGILWRVGKIISNERVTGDTPMFE